MFADSPRLDSRWHAGGRSVLNHFHLKASGFDRLFSLLLAAILLVGLLAAGLFVVWITSGPATFDRAPPEPGGGEFLGLDLTAAKPALDFAEPDLPEAVTQDLSSVLASLPSAVEQAMEDGGTKIKGPNVPARRDPSPVPISKGIGFERWQIEYYASDREHYRRQLDGLGIQFGIVNQTTNDITRLSRFTGGYSKTNSDRAAEKESVYFIPVKRSLRRWDEQIATDADCSVQDCFVVHFLADKTVQQLLLAEQRLAASQNKQIKQIKTTQFKVVESDGGFQLEIGEIRYVDEL